MGDASEEAFRTYADGRGVKYERFGFDRSALPRFWVLNPFIKSMPDFVCIKGNKGFLVECKGCGGRDSRDHFKVKEDDLDMYIRWGIMQPTFIFAWNSHTKQYSIKGIEDIREIALTRRNGGIPRQQEEILQNTT